MARRLFRVLSLDGGGIRGVVAARILSEIERRAGKPIRDLFDLIVGTSTGGMLATALVAPQHVTSLDSQGFRDGPYSAAFLQDLYTNHGKEIFPKSLWRTLRSLNGVLSVKYPATNFEAIAHHMFGDQRLRDVDVMQACRLVVTSFDTQTMRPYLFKSASDNQFFLRDVVRSTSAAPSYFPPHQLRDLADQQLRTLTLVDGGVFANNPSMVALAEALSNNNNNLLRSNILLCSVGTGAHDEAGYKFDRIKNWGEVNWMLPFMNIIADGQSAAANHQVKHVLAHGEDHSSTKPQMHFRFNARLVHGSTRMDDTSDENIQRLLQDANSILDTQKQEIEQLLQQLA